MVHVLMSSDKLLSRYGLLEKFDVEILHFEDVLDFDLQPHPQEWTLGPYVFKESQSYRVPMIKVFML